ncbi:TlpA family protein disulfide reductase [Virgisporangium aurantiacum]|uniref:Thioredoxin domain-containing protein n=1 Tax=Virgisporangium aurantiacum TaxID=175570 RepID=A0A8J3Z8B4_9ACTN|nr:TlpA disulfide reductase family protein [Virgisporangium aurantiacum]GIJ58907.1 hypothetical protein Vau01_064230 [Virgisporangium aurantiacum]
MTVQAVAVLVVGATAVLNLLLTFAVLRRLRLHAALLESISSGPEDLVGRTVPEFTVRTSEGETVSRSDLAGREYVIGFFSATCAPCKEQAPEFARLAEARSNAALSVVMGDGPGVDELRAALVGVPTVVVERDHPIAGEFGVDGFPSIMLVDAENTVVAAGASVRSLG